MPQVLTNMETAAVVFSYDSATRTIKNRRAPTARLPPTDAAAAARACGVCFSVSACGAGVDRALRLQRSPVSVGAVQGLRLYAAVLGLPRRRGGRSPSRPARTCRP